MIVRPLYLQKLFDFKDKPFIKVITGIRRCGKSSLLKTYIDELKHQDIPEQCILSMNFEDLQYDGMDYKTLNQAILKQIPDETDKVYVFLDEVQRVPQWEKAVNSLFLNERLDIYLTGSNAYLLSSELSTYLSGRFVEIKMLPLSFKEFLDFYTFPEGTGAKEKFALYLKFGGMPSLVGCEFDETKTRQVLEGIYNTVLIKDVLSRNDVKDIAVLQKLILFLSDNVGNITSTNKITQVLANEKRIPSANNKLIEKYITLLKNAFFIYPAGRYDVKGKDFLRSLEKYYVVDSGLKNFLVAKVSDTGRLIENVVFFELLRRGWSVSIGKVGDKEIDFIAIKGNEKKYIQVCESLSDETTREREFSALREVRDNFEKVVLTTDDLYTGITEDGIRVVRLVDWLLG